MTFGDLVDSFYVDAFLNIGRGNFDTGLRGGGLRGGNFAITRRAFRLNRYEYVPGVRLSGRWGSTAIGSGRCASTAPAPWTALSESVRRTT